MKQIVEDWAGQYTVDEVVDLILDAGIPAGPIFDMDDISKDEHIVGEREMLVKIDQPGIGEITVTNNPVKLSDTKPTIRRPSPLLGQHNEEVYGEWLNFGEDKIKELKEKGVI
jgi:crotonobetainyl-CoA:carnitine CoA-transferase CaiB-like acyl-CoA transferase